MIHISCPHCNSRLEVDPGFAGGICRCFNCGTLMTVPQTVDQQVEQLQRRERPERPDVPGGAPAPEPAGEQFITVSGRVIDLDRRKLEHVPVARKARMGVRVSVISAFVLFVIFMVIGLIWLMAELEKQKQGPDDQVVGQQVTVKTLGYDPAANPYRLEHANLFGLPIKGSAIAVVGSGSRMRKYLDPVKDLLVTNLKHMDEATGFQAVFATDEGPQALPETMKPPKQINSESFDMSLNTIRPAGRPDILAALEQALKAKPDEVVLVVYEPPSTEDLLKTEAMFKNSGTSLHAILLGSGNAAIKGLCAGTKGRCIELGGGQLQYWHEEWRNQR